MLDEPFYSDVPSVSDFIQSLPVEGGEPSERTEVWIGFDDSDIYVSARVWDSAPESEWVANEMRRDTNQLRQNDTFGVMFDTYYDRRNGVMFGGARPRPPTERCSSRWGAAGAADCFPSDDDRIDIPPGTETDRHEEAEPHSRASRSPRLDPRRTF